MFVGSLRLVRNAIPSVQCSNHNIIVTEGIYAEMTKINYIIIDYHRKLYLLHRLLLEGISDNTYREDYKNKCVWIEKGKKNLPIDVQFQNYIVEGIELKCLESYLC